MRIILPFPPSYNRYWRNGRNGRGFISKEGAAYKIAAAEVLHVAAMQPLRGRVSVSLDYYRPRKSGDLDNRLKQTLDALQGHAYDNDSQIVEIHARQFEDKSNPRVEVEVTEVKP